MGQAATSFQPLPRSYAERMATDLEIRVPATFEEYLEFAEQCDYKVEYSNGEIISMASPSDTHELIVINIGSAFKTALRGKGTYKVYGSNLGLWIKETDSHYKPDVTVLAEEPRYEFHKVKKRTVRSIVNPFAVVEVLSEGTKRYDFEQKLGHYKKCPSVQYVLLVQQKQPLVMLYRRTERPGEWISTDAEGMGDTFLLAGHSVALADVFEGVDFGAKEPGAAK